MRAIQKFNFYRLQYGYSGEIQGNKRHRSPIRTIMHTANKSSFASVEDSRNAVSKLRKIAGAAVKLAAEENRKLGLAAIIIRNNQVIQIDSQKQEKVIATLKQEDRKYKPGQVFYARKD